MEVTEWMRFIHRYVEDIDPVWKLLATCTSHGSSIYDTLTYLWFFIFYFWFLDVVILRFFSPIENYLQLSVESTKLKSATCIYLFLNSECIMENWYDGMLQIFLI